MELELGNLMFNTNANQNFECPRYIVALLRDIDRQLDRIMYNIEQKHYESPFDNTANMFKSFDHLFNGSKQSISATKLFINFNLSSFDIFSKSIILKS